MDYKRNRADIRSDKPSSVLKRSRQRALLAPVQAGRKQQPQHDQQHGQFYDRGMNDDIQDKLPAPGCQAFF